MYVAPLYAVVVGMAADNARAIEVSPTGRYIRYGEVLGRGAYKVVFRGFDKEQGIEVAWSKIALSNLEVDASLHTSIQTEIDLLKAVDCPSIVRLYASWFSDKENEFHLVTEIVLSGSLKEYLKRHGHVSITVVKKWTRELLDALMYLHSRTPPIVHRDVKCDNILVRGDTGSIKLGDLGLSTLMRRSSMTSVVGTPEFMAEEMFNSDYDERIDVYALGMCILEMVTLEYPFSECANIAQVYRKIISRQPPDCLQRLEDPDIKRLVKLCFLDKSKRPSAQTLRSDPCLAQKPERTPVSEGSAYRMSKQVEEARLGLDIERRRKNHLADCCWRIKQTLCQ
jgi:WNK lysine deficient protein kinase